MLVISEVICTNHQSTVKYETGIIERYRNIQASLSAIEIYRNHCALEKYTGIIGRYRNIQESLGATEIYRNH